MPTKVAIYVARTRLYWNERDM